MRFERITGEELEELQRVAMKRFIETFPVEDRWMFMANPSYEGCCGCCSCCGKADEEEEEG